MPKHKGNAPKIANVATPDSTAHVLTESTKTILSTEAEVEALCQSCGACCATFRVSFYWTETTASPEGWVPEHMTQPMPPHRACMQGTSQHLPRCIALQGEIAQAVKCGIYPQRPSPCREYEVFLKDGQLNPRCNQARSKHNLPPLRVAFAQQST